MPEVREEEFSVLTMNETWDMSNAEYSEILERQRRIEVLRARCREQQRQQRGLWRKIVDAIAPA